MGTPEIRGIPLKSGVSPLKSGVSPLKSGVSPLKLGVTTEIFFGFQSKKVLGKLKNIFDIDILNLEFQYIVSLKSY